MAGSGHGPEIVEPENMADLLKPHIESYDYFVERGLPLAVVNIPAVEVVHPTSKIHLRMWLERAIIHRPEKEQKEMGTSLDKRVLPSESRIGGTTYRGNFTADLCLQLSNGMPYRHTLSFGKMPIMVKSSLCHLRGFKADQLVAKKEEAMEMGGYFICNGIERIIRLLVITKRNIALAIERNAFRNRGPSYTDYGVTIRCARQDQSTVTVRLYYQNYGGATLGFSLRKQEYVIPVGIVLKALIDTSDREIFDRIKSVSLESKNKSAAGNHIAIQRARIILQEVQRFNLFTRIQCLEYLGEHFKQLLEVPANYSFAKVGEKILDDFILVHLENAGDKFNFLIFMLHKLFALVDGLAAPDNGDSLQYQEVLLPGHLLTMYVKERMQEWLIKLKGQILKEMQEKPAQYHLKTFAQVIKTADKVSASDICKKVEYLLSTGNLSTQTGLDLPQASGFTVVADKLNFLRYLAHFRSIHRGAFFTTLRTTTIRKLLPESWGFLCPVHTPDGSPCGLLCHLTAACSISTDLDSRGNSKQKQKILKKVTSELVRMGMRPAVPSLERVSPPTYLTVQLDGRIIGNMLAVDIPKAVACLRELKVTRNTEIPADLEIAYIPCTLAGAYPGLYLFSTPGRFLRPVKQLASEHDAIELISPCEQAYMEIKCPDGGDGGSAVGSSNPTHEETSPMAMLSVVASLTPWSDHNQSPRNMYQCQMAKQTMGTPAQAIRFRYDNKLYRLQTPQTPVARTEKWKKYNVDQFPTGTNAIVAVLAYTGYDMEDAMILNKSSMERGLCHGQVYKTDIVDMTKERRKGDLVTYEFRQPFGAQRRELARENLDAIDSDGLPYIGEVMKEDQVYCTIFNTLKKTTKVCKVKGAEEVIVDSVAVIGQGLNQAMQKVVVRTRQPRNPQVGDKFSSRHGQKGVLSQLYPDEDMPFSAVTGMRPDLIINPHAFPSRMTIGMLLESIAAKVGSLKGKFVDATPFQKCTTGTTHTEGKGDTIVDDYGKQLKEYGFNYHGTEVMYSGVLGTEMACEIYMGVVYYQRLRHMVSDKYQVRSVGQVNPVTRQPVKGRKMGGGIRFGEMERDALLAHGAAYLLHDRLHKCSDYHIADVCAKCGSLLSTAALPPKRSDQSGAGNTLPLGGSNEPKVICKVCDSSRDVASIAMPFVFRYLAVELAAMNIKMTLNVADD